MSLTLSSVSRDISGCATSELSAVFHRFRPQGTTSRDWVMQKFPNWDERDFQKLINGKYPFTGLKIVDEITTALGLNLNELCQQGLLTIVPSGMPSAPLRMVEEQIAAEMEETIEAEALTEDEVKVRVQQHLHRLGPEEIERRCEVLRSLRATHVVPTPEQQETLRKDSERSSQRIARQRAAKRAVA